MGDDNRYNHLFLDVVYLMTLGKYLELFSASDDFSDNRPTWFGITIQIFQIASIITKDSENT